MRKLAGLAISIIALAAGAAAQSNVTTTNGGTAGTVPAFTTGTNIENSPISVSNGNVGIGTTTSPEEPLVVNGEAAFGAGSGSTLGSGGVLISQPAHSQAAIGIWQQGIAYSYLGSKASDTNLYLTNDYNAGGLGTASESITLTTSGSVGIGTTAPQAALNVHGNSQNTGSGGFMLDASDSGNPAAPDYYLSINPFVVGSGEVGYQFKTVSSAGGANIPLTFSNAGSVGIGTTSPGATLEVNGNVKLTAGSGASITFQDGTVQSTAYTGVLPGGDYADTVDVDGDRAKYGPGDLLVIDPDHPGKFLKSAEPYSTSVAGIFSTKPGALGRRQTGPKKPDEVPMAMVGIVPTKVSAENGPIRPGDLLVTASLPGYAMKGTDRSRMLGAVVGKALGSLDRGTGVIEVVVTLQ